MKCAIIGPGLISTELASFLAKKKNHVTVAAQNPEQLKAFSKTIEKSILLKDFDEEGLLPIIMNNQLILVPLSSDSLEEAAPLMYQTIHGIRRIASQNDLSRRIILMSSTAVYGDHHGLWVDETSSLKTKAVEGKTLIESERLCLSLADFNWNVCVLRIAEIYGPDKEISKRLTSLKGPLLGSGKTYTNMIHWSDVIGAIDYCIRHQLEGIYNLADDEHPTREEFYRQLAEKHHLPPFKWKTSPEWKEVNKRVSNHKIKATGFSLKYSHRVLDGS